MHPDKTHSSEHIVDPVRHKRVVNTPEEGVRQAIIQFLNTKYGIPLGLMKVEQVIDNAPGSKRADLIVYARSGKPWMLVECKAPSVSIEQATFDQIAQYNRYVQAPYLFVSNGTEHFCMEVVDNLVTFIDDIPTW